MNSAPYLCARFVRQILDALRNAGGLGSAPVVPAVVAPADDLVPAGMDSGEAHGRRRGIRAGFTQVYPLRARDHVHQKLCQLRLDRTCQRGHKAVSDLGNGCLVHFVDAVAEGNGAVAHDIVCISIAVDVPEICALRLFNEQREPARDVVFRRFRLRRAMPIGLAGTLVQLIEFCEFDSVFQYDHLCFLITTRFYRSGSSAQWRCPSPWF